MDFLSPRQPTRTLKGLNEIFINSNVRKVPGKCNTDIPNEKRPNAAEFIESLKKMKID